MRASPRIPAAVVFVLAMNVAQLAAQSSKYGIEDILDNASTSAGALSNDGRWLIATKASLRDRIGIDNYRFGDPTYAAPSAAEITVIDTKSGEARRLFNEKRQARAFEWSPDGSRLAFTSSRTGILDVYTMAADGTAPTRIASGFALDSNPDW